ncbi:MAG: DPP IV N-terminal domain-containing protein [Candidatus Aminicenantes bacterium]|nr:MAG: DPP IV N-terminal domain-containing protein [Candidatus Aminicenantes bacterium]
MQRYLNTRWIGILIILTAMPFIFQHVNCRARDDRGAEIPQIKAEDYVRAEQWMIPNVISKVKNLFVTPHWIGESDDFWYRRQTKDGAEFVVIDAATGGGRPAFDHKAVAEALSKAMDSEVDAKKLPFQRFEYNADRSAITFTLKDVKYRCELSPQTCTGTKVDKPEGVLVSPDGMWGVLTRDGNLWLRNMANNKEKALTSDGEPHFGYGIYYDGWKASYIPNKRAGKLLPPMESYWSPDSSKVIVTRVDQRHVAEYPILETAPNDGTFRAKVHMIRVPLVGEKEALAEWFVFDISQGKHRRLNLPYEKLLVMQQDMLAIRKTWFSSDNSHLYAVAFGYNMESAFLFDIDLMTGAVRTVIEEQVLPRTDLNSTSYSPPNVRVKGDCEEVIWFSQRDGWGHLYLYDGKTGKLKNQITKGDWLVWDIVHVDESNRQIFFTGGGRAEGNPYYRFLYRVNFDGSDLVLLSPEKADHLITSPWNDILSLTGAAGYDVVSPSGKYVVYNYSLVDQPTETVIRSVEDGSLIASVEKADVSDLYAAGWQNPEEFVVKAEDGKTDLYGLMYKPRNFDPNKKYPVIDSQYASPLTAVVPRNFTQALIGVGLVRPASLTELGFVCVVFDARGTTYRSKEFLHYSYGKLHTMGLEDHVAGIKQLAKRHSFMDIERVGVHGGSFGGWTAFRAMLEFPGFFKVGVSGAGPGSMQNMYLDYHWTAFHGRPKYSDGTELRPTPTEVPENYVNADGRQQVENLKGKLLIMMGEIDENVLPGSTLQFVDALIKADKNFDMLYVPNRPHNFRSPHVIRRAWDYFVLHLHGAEPPEYHIKKWGR